MLSPNPAGFVLPPSHCAGVGIINGGDREMNMPRAALQRIEESGWHARQLGTLGSPPSPEESGLGVDGEVVGHAE